MYKTFLHASNEGCNEGCNESCNEWKLIEKVRNEGCRTEKRLQGYTKVSIKDRNEDQSPLHV